MTKLVFVFLGLIMYHFLMYKLIKIEKLKLFIKSNFITLLLFSFFIPIFISLVIVNIVDFKIYGFCTAISVLYAKYIFNTIYINNGK